MKRQHTDSRKVIALDLGGTKLAVAVSDEHGKLSPVQTLDTDLSSRQATLGQLLAAVEDARSAAPRAKTVGISIPGLVRSDGTVWAPNLPGWKRVPVARFIEDATGLRAVVESDRNASVVGEAWKGAARGEQDAIYLIVGTGIGAGIIAGGRLIRGADELSGCAGWLVVTGGGGLFPLESVAAGPGIARAAAGIAGLGDKCNARDVYLAAENGNSDALAVIERAATHLGVAVANLISLFNPRVIVLGGGVGTSGPLLLNPLRKVALRYAQPLAARRVKIVPSRLGAGAPLYGAARLALDLPGARP